MGFKSSTNHKNLSNNNSNNNFQIGGLIFDSKEDYLLLKFLDNSIESHLKLIKDDNFKDFFSNFKKVNVRETYVDAREELDSLFNNTTNLLCYEGTRYNNEYKFACCFFDNINVIEYLDSDDD